MSTIIKIVLTFGIFATVLLLSGCGSIQKLVAVPVLEKPSAPLVNMPKPLELRDIKFEVIVVDGVTYIAMDLNNYSKMAKNMEDIQGKLHEYNIIITDLHKFINN